jgi:manganese-dependent inorganic pyrophosphatase
VSAATGVTPPWDPSVTYVVGHQRPDTDAIASALGYAWYLSEAGEANVAPARAGAPGAETTFALQRFGLALPGLLTAVAPTFATVVQPQVPVAPDDPLAEAAAQLEAGARAVPVVDVTGYPYGVVTPMALIRAYAAPPAGRGSADRYPGADRTARARPSRARAAPCRDVMAAAPVFAARAWISDYRAVALRSEADDFLIIDEAGRYIGMATRARILEPPRARLIRVDHNELSQAVAGADQAEIVAVLDHHRLGNPQTAAPISFVVEPVGSTCTLVAEQCRRRGLSPPAGLAGVMLSGILSDTIAFRSPTTGDRDRTAADWLAGLAGVDAVRYGEELLGASPGLAGRDAGEVVDADRKRYEMEGKAISLAQVEVASFEELSQTRSALLEVLEVRRQSEHLDLIGLMITDVIALRSRLLCRGEPRILASLPFASAGGGEWDLGNIVSRKKQLVPVLHTVLEQTG